MCSPILASFLIVLIFLISPFFNPLPAVFAETSLTFELEGQEFAIKIKDLGKNEQFAEKHFFVKTFNKRDQCMASPENHVIFSLAFFFQLPHNGFNGGNGLTICHVGQLDPLNQIKPGLMPSRLMQVSNVGGNEVAKVCEKAQAKMAAKCKGKEKEAECLEFANAQWHGFNIRQKKNSRDMEMRLSTTQNVFIIPHERIKNGQFFLKLTTFDSVIAKLSTEIGPGYNEYEGRRQISLEKKGIIRVENDEKLRKAYFINVKKGAFLGEYMGIFALSADILPHEENNNLQFYVIRSECSEMESSFLIPSDAGPNLLERKELKAKAFPPAEVVLTKEKQTILRGKVDENAKEFKIILTSLMVNESSLQGVRMLAKFDSNGIGVAEIQICRKTCNNEEWIPLPKYPDQGSILFKRGLDFRMKILKEEDHFKISMNCAKFKTIKFGERNKLRIGNRYKFIISGDVQIYEAQIEMAETAKNNETKQFSWAQSVQNKEGLLIEAKMDENWNNFEFVVKLFRKDTKRDGKFLTELSLNATNDHSGTKIVLESNFFGWKGEMDSKLIKDGAFELYVQFNDNKMDITLNDKHLTQFVLEHQPSADYIQVYSDVPIEIRRNETIAAMPNLMKISDRMAIGDVIQINGKILPNAASFEIRMLVVFKSDFVNAYEFGKCNKLGSECYLALNMHANFKTNKLYLGNKENNNEVLSSPFGRAEFFSLQFLLENDKVLRLVKGDFSKDWHTKESVAHINFIEFSGDIWLFGEPQIQKKKDGK